MYKLKTNQLDVPLSRLELLSTPKRQAAPSAAAAATSPPRAVDVDLEEPGSATPRPQHRQLMDVESPEKEEEEMLTPLPRHMQTLATEGEGAYEELTSSGVKGRAVDGLLSLMGVRE